MTAATGALAHVEDGSPEPSLDLIHRSNCSNPHERWAAARFATPETGYSDTVHWVAFCMFVKLKTGGYANTN